MPGFLLHQGATILCIHGGQAQATAPNPRVRVNGQAVVTQPAPHAVAGCPFVTPGPGSGPGGSRCCCRIARPSACPTAQGSTSR
jgi:hypothetical protein